MNPGNPALCLALSRPSAVAPRSPPCGPYAEDATYITAAGPVIHGTRSPLGSNFANDDYQGSFGNSSYKAFEASVRHSGQRLDFMLAYTFSKSLDQASSIPTRSIPSISASRARSRPGT
jgi:hypothetical protein